MRSLRLWMILMVLSAFVPTVLSGFDFPGYVTMHGKVIDADTLKPIEGAVVWAMWDKCHPGLGHGPACDVSKTKEVLTDANGEWSITGPSGNRDPGIIRAILGVFVSWDTPPRLGYYKPGYYPFNERYPVSGDFSAFPYVDKEKNVEGIVLIRMGDTEEEVRRYMEQWDKDRCKILIPMKDPERKLRDLDFDFKYPENVERVQVSSDMTRYKVIGLKRAVTPKEKQEAESLGGHGIFPGAYQPVLRRALEN